MLQFHQQLIVLTKKIWLCIQLVLVLKYLSNLLAIGFIDHMNDKHLQFTYNNHVRF